jgi:hypothetical protein
VDFPLYGYFFLRRAPKRKTASAASADNTAGASSRIEAQSADSASGNIRFVMEQLQALHTRMDEHAMTHTELRDHPVAIHTAAIKHVD